ncbi:hypothetical protein F5Y15DRAFT_60850 [Xylariaceae sp. FL0016]|nr:hypothetical protein F5Y15DRAFT_60850 [Xylariaceae sp. FL0016]
MVLPRHDLYKVLGVPRNATGVQIRKAYHDLARTEHPDKKGNTPAGNEKFAKINEAYETLKDPGKRQEYDDSFSGGSRAGGHADGQRHPGHRTRHSGRREHEPRNRGNPRRDHGERERTHDSSRGSGSRGRDYYDEGPRPGPYGGYPGFGAYGGPDGPSAGYPSEGSGASYFRQYQHRGYPGFGSSREYGGVPGGEYSYRRPGRDQYGGDPGPGPGSSGIREEIQATVFEDVTRPWLESSADCLSDDVWRLVDELAEISETLKAARCEMQVLVEDARYANKRLAEKLDEVWDRTQSMRGRNPAEIETVTEMVIDCQRRVHRMSLASGSLFVALDFLYDDGTEAKKCVERYLRDWASIR